MAKWKMDFSGVTEGFKDLVAGTYEVKVKGLTKEEGNEYPYLKWELQVYKGSYKGSNIRMNTSLSPKALWRLRNTLIALGLKVPKSQVSLDPNKLVGLAMGVEINMRDYEGKTYPNVLKVFKLSDLEDVEPVEEEDMTIGGDEEVEDGVMLMDDDL